MAALFTRRSRQPGSLAAGGVVWAIVGLCALLPLGWLAGSLLGFPAAWGEAWPDAWRWGLLGRTLLYNGLAAAGATLLAIPVAAALGRGRSVFAKSLWLVLPVPLVLPSIVLTYGWKEALRHLGIEPIPADPADVARCIVSLAAWLWPVPAAVIGLALRRLDPAVQEQATLDGARGRVTAAALLPAAVAGFAAAFVLAGQEFSVYDATGVSVVATEVRMVYQTGAFLDARPTAAEGYPSLTARSASAAAVGLPLLLVILGAAGAAGHFFQRGEVGEQVNVGGWPRALDAGPAWTLGAWGVVALALGVPVISMWASLSRPFNPLFVWREIQPQAVRSLEYAAAAGGVGLVAAGLCAVARARLATAAAVAGFLIGGQLLAVGLIRLYDRPWLGWVYGGPGIVVMADLGRFAWVALAAGLWTWSRPFAGLRDAASADGATALQTATRVILPLAWPTLAAAAVLVAALSLTEVPAAILLGPPTLIPMMISWVHILRFDPMIEASLLIVLIVLGLSATVAALAVAGRRRLVGATGRRTRRPVLGGVAGHGSASTPTRGTMLVALCLVPLVLISGCDLSKEPDAIWGETGRGPGQLVYPRAIAYAPADGSFFVVDRTARVQHFDRDGKFLNGWSMPANQLGKPVGVSVGPDGNVWVPDTHYHRVIVYTPAGKEVLRFGGPYDRRKGESVSGGEFIYPTDVAFDSKGRVFVSEYGGHDRVQVFTPTGTFLYAFGHFGEGPGEFNRPQSMVIEGDTVFITDACNHRIVVYKTDGTYVRTFGGLGGGPGEFRFPYGLDRDAAGNLVVCEFGNNRVQKVDPASGRSLGLWGEAGRAPGQLAYPWGVAVDARGRVVTVDAGNNRLQVFNF